MVCTASVPVTTGRMAAPIRSGAVSPSRHYMFCLVLGLHSDHAHTALFQANILLHHSCNTGMSKQLVEKLRRTINIGTVQVSLMRQMEKSTRDFADWRKEREKEVMQLRRQASLASKFHTCMSALCFYSNHCSRCGAQSSWAT